MTAHDTQILDPARNDRRRYPPGFRRRRGRNWLLLGLTYASYYLCRYNLDIDAPELKDALGFSNTQYGAIDAARNWAYALGQFLNGLFTDKLGGRRAMTIGAVGTVLLNFAFGLTAWSKIGWLFAALLIIRLCDGYVQSFGAPGFIKINTAWFTRRERGTFAGIFGFMINLGQFGVGNLAPLLAKGFAVPLIFFTLTIPKMDWRYMFIVPPCLVIIIVVLMLLGVKNTPEEAGFSMHRPDEDPGDDSDGPVYLAVVFRTIASNPIVWTVAGAYFCTGFVRTAIYSWYAIYLEETWSVTKTGQGATLFWWFAAMLLPWLASIGSLGSGMMSDKLFGGRRTPVAAALYGIQALFIVVGVLMSEGVVYSSALWSVIVILAIHVGCNSTHSILGTAAAMDLGGRKMAGFASGLIDSFQYIGAGLAGLGLGWFLDHFALRSGTGAGEKALLNPTVWFASMLPFALLGAALMAVLAWRHRGKSTRGT